MTSFELRKKFLEFFEKRGHTIVPCSSLIPTDPSVLFTTAGMQQFKPYYLGEKSPCGPNVASVQKCIRTSDIEEVGDERHLTFFEMLGNFSFGGYFKEEAIKLAYDFIVGELNLEIDYVTVFNPDKVEQGDWRKGVAEDKESFEIWKKYLPENKIKLEGVDNFWGPTGSEGPCGPTAEIYVRGIEIWNIVFNEFFCDKNKKLKKLEIQGIDTGMGLERLAMVTQKVPTVFETDLFGAIIKEIERLSDEEYKNNKQRFRVISDHVKSAVFLTSAGILPSNVGQGYVLRRLIRRVIRYTKVFQLKENLIHHLFNRLLDIYGDIYPELKNNKDRIIDVIIEEGNKFNKTIEDGLKIIDKAVNESETSLSAKFFFDLYQSYGFPFELAIEEVNKRRKIQIPNDIEKHFNKLFKEHQKLSQTSSAGMFKGGLADEKSETVRLHTAHHLLLAAMQTVLGKSVKQRGSNINSERLRIDFSFDRKLTDEEKKKIEDVVNEKIKEGLDVARKEMPKEEAEKTGAEMEFGVKYGNTVSVYFIKDKKGNVFSKEFCGGPHVKNTSELGKFKIIKEEAVSSGARRIKAALE